MVRLPHERFNCQGSHSFLGSDYRQEMSQIQSFCLSARAMLSQASRSQLTTQFMLSGFGGVFYPFIIYRSIV